MYVYFHRNPSTYQIFYVGIGVKKNRAYDIKGRNPYWVNYTKKHGTPVVQIVHSNISKQESYKWEKFYISLLGKKNSGGQLVNITNGGETRPSEVPEVLERIRKSVSDYYTNNPDAKNNRSLEMKRYNQLNPDAGNNRKEKFNEYFLSPDFKEKSINTLTEWIKNNPNKNPMFNPEVVAKFKGENNSSKRPEVRAKLRTANLGKKASDETRLKQSLLKKGKPSNQPIGYKHSPEVIERLRIINKENANTRNEKHRLLKLGTNT